jgi:hypothetical protein
MLYRFYLLDRDDHIRAAETFCSPDDATAQETADLVYDACDDEFRRYELWRSGERVARGWPGANAAGAPRLSDVVSAREENILDLEERLQQTFACVRKSRKLLEITSALRNRINGV